MPHPNVYKTECPLGHPYSDENTVTHRGKRSCRECRNQSARGRRERGLSTGDKRHGTVNGYSNFSCRCTLCKTAYSESYGPRGAKAKYGLPESDYWVLADRFESQGCDLCGDFQSMQIDHCHYSGRVRGVLCGSCNSGLGKFKDDPERLRKAASYLLGGKLEVVDFEGDL